LQYFFPSIILHGYEAVLHIEHRIILDAVNWKSKSLVPSYVNYVSQLIYEGWNFNSGNYLFTTDTK